ncbi:Trifunctional UDP-glucose 4,6-dehydratase/UDP-4-keto-6 [Seminavis robusta]|uniref:UDP-glucuronate decarboxylase n=1 Tax=Seminavis robusta TaxID=568900 RepID=A0A9N8H383_9STRA|nr:Trifunctional UDP-glucose 4,6-dehydratase/UDP-4-keto-6 [Seminavis robusta]|eukprot:Sro54_g031800.1 Trifunctional UDP-glucose 4,6-dehydratase/UDP-4-keto-6 (467) ;mRNA; f:48499-49999
MARLQLRAGKSPAQSPAERDNQTLPQRRTPTKSTSSSGGGMSSFFSRQSVMMLAVGLLTGYVILPIFLIETKIRGDYVYGRLPQITTSDEVINRSRMLPENDRSAALERLMEDRDVMAHQSLPTSTTPQIMRTKTLPDHHRKKILVTGGAGFVGSHLVDKLMQQGHEVIVVDNFFTGQKKNIAHWLHHPNFSLVVHDVTEEIMLEVDQIYHLACPASPPHYQYNPVKTIKTSTMGTLNMLGLAKRVKARILLTSTSEIYGDPQEHPQKESYWGNVNTVGPRSCYDEGKRVAETMMYSYKNQNHVEVRVARIFNTFGPRMHPNDGRVVSNFIIQALQNKDMTIYGAGEQTRSFQYVSDLVEGLHALMNGKYDMPVNLGNPDEYSVKDFAEYVHKMTESQSKIEFLPKSQDDPSQRRPDITTAKEKIGWEPQVTVENGLKKTIEYFQSVLDEAGEIIPTGPGAAKPEA